MKMLSDMHFKIIHCQYVLSQEATRKHALPKQGNKAWKKNEEGEGPYSQSEWNPQEDDDRIVQEDICVSDREQPGNKRKQKVPGACLQIKDEVDRQKDAWLSWDAIYT